MKINSYGNLNRLFAVEGMGAGAPTSAGQNNYSLFSKLTKAEEDGLNALIAKHCSVESIDTVTFGEEAVKKHMIREQDKKFHQLTAKILGPAGNTFMKFLPGATRKLVNELKSRQTSLRAKESNANTANEKMAYAFEAEQCQNTLEQIVFGTLTTANEVNAKNKTAFGHLYSTESMQTYASTVFYPVFENTVVWFNAAGTVYTKLIPIKQVANEITQPVIHTLTYVLQKIDKDAKVIDQVERSELYRSFNDPKYAHFRQYLEKKIKFDKTEFKKIINLKNDNLAATGAPALLPLENIKSDFTIIAHTVKETVTNDEGVDEEVAVNKGEIAITSDYTITASPAANESYYNGQAFYHWPDRSKKDKFYILSLNYNSIDCSLLISADKAQGAEDLPDIEDITFRFKLHDVNFVARNDTRWQIYERPAFLETPTAKKHEINHNMNEFQLMGMRNDAEQLSRLMGLHTEQVGNDKEAMFYEGIDTLNASLHEEKKNAQLTNTEDHVLYLHNILDLATKNDVNKLEGLGMRLGGELAAFVQNYNYIAKAQMNTSMSMLCHSTSIGIISQATKAISGTVNADSNGGFLGVDVETRTHVITMGTDASSPVSAIIVGTDKDDLKAAKYDASGNMKAKGDIEYDFVLFPRFQEANLATNLMIETPSRVISDPSYKSETNRNIPATFIEYAAQFQSIRNAGGKLTIKGSLVTGVM